ncbi:MAG: hypothetical protein PHC69_00975, partial [Ruminiclostridium sp.]|nr:hypothetical protein [Ruminiclostridium sp.]
NNNNNNNNNNINNNNSNNKSFNDNNSSVNYKGNYVSNEKIDFDVYLNNSVLDKYLEIIYFNKNEFEKLLEKAIQTIRQAKKYHDELENYYVPNMNYTEVTKCRDATLARLSGL